MNFGTFRKTFLASMIAIIAVTVVWEKLNRPIEIVAMCDGSSNCTVPTGTIASPVLYKYNAAEGSELLYMNGASYRILTGPVRPIILQLAPHRQYLDELPADALRWYTLAREAKNERARRQKTDAASIRHASGALILTLIKL